MLPTLMLASVRPGAAFLAAPVLGLPQVPVFLRFVLALAVGVPSSFGMQVPSAGLLPVIAGEVLIGLALGFALQAGFAAASVAGELIANAMGLGFASMIDPASGRATPAISQVLSILATLLFLSIDGHLAFVTVIVESFRTLPMGGGLISAHAVSAIIELGGAMFAGAVTLALPVVTGVILVQLVMALLARSAPAMNLFAVGLPAALLAGFALFAFALPVMGQAIVRILIETLRVAGQIA